MTKKFTEHDASGRAEAWLKVKPTRIGAEFVGDSETNRPGISIVNLKTHQIGELASYLQRLYEKQVDLA